MKRLVLLSLAALMLAATVFAPAATAQEPGDADIQSVTLGAGGTAVLTGTIQCTEGWQYRVYAEAWQTSGNRPNNSGSGEYPKDFSPLATCQTSGPETFTITVVGERPFKKGTVWVRERSVFCPPLSACDFHPLSDFKELRIR
jgi:hypothetical protein